MNGSARRTLLALGLVASTLGLAFGLAGRADLRRVPFLSGWLLFLPLAVGALAWWFARPEPARLARRARLQLWLCAALVPGYAVHGELRLPVGWTETALTLLLLALLASAARSAWLLRHSAPRPPEHLARWVRVQVALTFALASLAAFHGILVHGHGMLAHFFLHG